MGTASDEILARYKLRKSRVDAFGREITVRRLRPSEQTHVLRLSETDDPSVQTVLTIAASVQKIEEDLMPFPKTLAELNSVLDRLDDEGLEAATKAYLEMRGKGEITDPNADPLAQAKN